MDPESGVLYLRSAAYHRLPTNTVGSDSEQVLCVWAAPQDNKQVYKAQRFDLYDLARNSEIGIKFYNDVAFRVQALDRARSESNDFVMAGEKDPGGSRSPGFQVETRRTALRFFIQGWSIRPEVAKVFSADPMSYPDKVPINTYRLVLVPSMSFYIKYSQDFERKRGIATPPYDPNVRAHTPMHSPKALSPSSSRRSSIKSRASSASSRMSTTRRHSSTGSTSSSKGSI
jgi:hypothetical protein